MAGVEGFGNTLSVFHGALRRFQAEESPATQAAGTAALEAVEGIGKVFDEIHQKVSYEGSVASLSWNHTFCLVLRAPRWTGVLVLQMEERTIKEVGLVQMLQIMVSNTPSLIKN